MRFAAKGGSKFSGCGMPEFTPAALAIGLRVRKVAAIRRQLGNEKGDARQGRGSRCPEEKPQLNGTGNEFERGNRMTIRLAGLTWLRTDRMAAVALMLGLFLGLARVAAAQEARDSRIDAATAPSPSLSTPQASLAERTPGLRALVIARGNCIAFEYYRKDIGAETQSPVHSVTKSVLSILIGIAIDEGYLRLDEKLSEILPDAFDENTDSLARDITVRDVLTKTEGFAEAGQGDFKMSNPAAGRELWRWMLNRRVAYRRATHFRYDGIGSDLLAVVLSKAIKQDAGDFAKRKLFDPLGIANYTWYADSEGYMHGESGLHLTARDMAKIGILYLQHGRWGETQIVSADYVQDSTTRHNDGGPPLNAGYGYQWWISKNGNVFFASGLHGQLISVTPKRDLVLAIAADWIPGGTAGFVRDVVLPITDALPDPAPCTVQVGQDGHAR
jgi:CubicO group peptidase (beta-lactamase class C family)